MRLIAQSTTTQEVAGSIPTIPTSPCLTHRSAGTEASRYHPPVNNHDALWEIGDSRERPANACG